VGRSGMTCGHSVVSLRSARGQTPGLTVLLLFLLFVPVENLQKEIHHQKDQADLQG
jgi:hypothetical protein